MLFDNVNWNNGTFFQIPGNNLLDNQTQVKETKFLTPEEGFLRGNLMKNEYDAYKNMTFFKLKPDHPFLWRQLG